MNITIERDKSESEKKIDDILTLTTSELSWSELTELGRALSDESGILKKKAELVFEMANVAHMSNIQARQDANS